MEEPDIQGTEEEGDRNPGQDIRHQQLPGIPKPREIGIDETDIVRGRDIVRRPQGIRKYQEKE